jgi:hypothetical protein
MKKKPEKTERREGYIDIAERLEAVYKEQATTNANLQNIISMFETHLADDKATVNRVNSLAQDLSGLMGKFNFLTVAVTGTGSFIGVIIGAIISVLAKK